MSPSQALPVLELTWVFLAPCFSLSVSEAGEIAEGGASDWATGVDLTDSHIKSYCSQRFVSCSFYVDVLFCTSALGT